MGVAIDSERATVGRVETKRLADDWIEIRLFDADGELQAITELKPAYHALFSAHLLAAQSEAAALEASEPREGRVLMFPPPVVVQVLSLLLLLVA